MGGDRGPRRLLQQRPLEPHAIRFHKLGGSAAAEADLVDRRRGQFGSGAVPQPGGGEGIIRQRRGHQEQFLTVIRAQGVQQSGGQHGAPASTSGPLALTPTLRSR